MKTFQARSFVSNGLRWIFDRAAGSQPALG
jgi:hypothetical protein